MTRLAGHRLATPEAGRYASGMPLPVRPQLGTPVVAAILAVIVAFVAALWASHARTSEISTRAHAIETHDDRSLTVEHARQISRAHDESRDLAFALGIGGIVAALVAGGVALHVIRRRSRLLVEYSELLDARATELEAFAYRVAHDLRSPLGSLSLGLHAMRLEQDDDDAVHLDRLSRGVARMDRLINDLLAFASSGARPDGDARAEVADVFSDVLADAEHAIARARADVVVDRPTGLAVACSHGTLVSMVGNLVNNAARYIVDGSAPHRIGLRAVVHGDRVRIEITDNGPGLPPGAEQLVFEPFRRGPTRREGGLGIGLATVKRLAEAHRGRVGVRSTPGRGSTFWIELPVATEPVRAASDRA